MGKEVFITSIVRETETGLHSARNPSSDKAMGKNKRGKANTRLMALYNPKVGGLANYISYNYASDAAGNPLLDEKGNRVKLQAVLEQKYNKPEGFYTNLSPHFDMKPDDATYFQRKAWALDDGTTMLDLDHEDDEMFYYVILESPLVANSEREWLEHKWPRAQFYISLENESAEIKHQRNKVKIKAMGALADKALTDTWKFKFCVLLGLLNAKAPTSIETTENNLYDFISNSTTGIESNISKFLKLFEMLSTAQGKETLEARFLLQQAIDTRVVFEKQDVYTWVRPKGNIVIGDRYSEAIDYLTNPKKDSERQEIEGDVKRKLL